MKDGLIGYNYASKVSNIVYDIIIAKADVTISKNDAKCIFRFYNNGVELPHEQREFNTIINKHEDIFNQVYEVGKYHLGFEDHIVDENGVTLNVRG